MPEWEKTAIRKIRRDDPSPDNDAMSVAVTVAKDWAGWRPDNKAQIKVRSDGAVLIRPVEVEETVRPVGAMRSEDDGDE